MNNTTLCITMGRRPELLKQTLTSLLSQSDFEHIVAINDFRDEATNEVFKAMCPAGELISLDRQLGHHAAVDHMYQRVKTDWIFHTEDDWQFSQPIDLNRLTKVISKNPWMSGICLRSEADFELSEADQRRVVYESHDEWALYRLDAMHKQWHGYTFNPHLAPVSVWKRFGPFSTFKKERHISRAIRQSGLVMPYLVEGGCRHIGWDNSVSHKPPTPSFWSRWFR